MSQPWFYLVAEQAIGPISLDELRAAFAAGALKDDTQVREGFFGPWQLAGQVSGLSAVSSAAEGVLAPPIAPPAAPPISDHPVASTVLLEAPPVVVRTVADAKVDQTTTPGGSSSPLPTRLLITVLSGLLTGLVVMVAASMATRAPHGSRAAAKAEIAAAATPGDTSAEQVVIGNTAEDTGNKAATVDVALAAAVPSPGAAEKAGPPGMLLARNDLSAGAARAGVTPASKSTEKLPAKPAPVETVFPLPPQQNPYEEQVEPTAKNKIDELVFAQLKKLGIQPARLCADAVFLRRVFLDVIGTLPTSDEAKAFLQDRDPNKRAVLIDRLLVRREFADYWAMRWSDLLRVKAEFPINLWPNAAQAYYRWIHTAIRENMPYDKFARALLTSSGSNFRVPQVNFYRAMQSKQPSATAQVVALTFMGIRADKWPKERLDGMAAFFSQIAYKGTGEWKEEIVMYDPNKAAATAGAAPLAAVFPDGTPAKLTPDQDPREAFADWLIDAKNPWFAPCIVNHLWYWVLGRGIVEEPDDFRPDNPPENPQLLAWLAAELVSAHYDLKHIYRLILNSSTYQLSSIGRSSREDAADHFAQYGLRRLEAEVLADALCQITGSTEKYTSAIPEPFTFIPEDMRSIALPDGSITSAFLEMFGRPPRDSGLERERNNRVNASQRLHLLNSTHVRQKIVQSGRIQALGRSKTPKDLADGLYLLILSRWPTAEELSVVRAYAGKGQMVMDVAWALINSDEFLYRH